MCLEMLLSGLLASAIDAMRDVMEIELLLLDFTATPANGERWSTAGNDERWNRFRPGAIRRRLSTWGHIQRRQMAIKLIPPGTSAQGPNGPASLAPFILWDPVVVRRTAIPARHRLVPGIAGPSTHATR